MGKIVKGQLLLVLILALSACNLQEMFSKLGRKASDDEHKGGDVTRAMSRGDLSGAVNRMTDPPDCPECGKAKPTRRRRPSSTVNIHMVAQIADISCLNSREKPSLAELGIRFTGTSPTHRQVVSKLAGKIYELAGPAMTKRLIGNMRVNVVQQLRKRRDGNCLPAHQLTPGVVTVAKSCPTGQKIYYKEGIFLHEVGHYAANRAGLYPSYNRNVKTRCGISTYTRRSNKGAAHRTRNDEFAEVFSAYLTAPATLKSKCPQAYRHMRSQIFTKKDHSCR